MYLKNLNSKILRILEFSFIFLALTYFFFAAYFFLKMPGGYVDEILFVRDLELIRDQGWITAIKKNVSIPYMILVFPIMNFLGTVVALRVINILLVILLFYYFYRREIKRTTAFFLLFYIASAGFFFNGTNNTIFFFFLVVFFNEAYLSSNNKSYNLNLAMTSLVIAVFTRELFLVYLPVIILGIYIFCKGSEKLNRKSWIVFGVFMLLIILNIPSLKENGMLSYDKKSPPQSLNVTWTQRQYLAQLMVNEGSLQNYQHPNWEQTRDYLKVHGANSLPVGIIAGITQDYSLTIKEFFKDLIYIIIYSSRGIGLILIIVCGYFLINAFQNRQKILTFFVPIAALTMIFIFSVIIISYIELRWLSAILIMLIIYYGDLVKEDKISGILRYSNLIYFCFVAIYGLFRLLPKIF